MKKIFFALIIFGIVGASSPGYPFAFNSGGGSVTPPSSSIADNAVCFSDTTGKVFKDCGSAPGGFDVSTVTGYTEDTTPTSDDLVVTVNDPGGTAALRKVTRANFFLPYISDTAYDETWDGVTTIAPSKNSVYDQIATVLGSMPTQTTLHVDDILTALGIASEATHFGTFTGSTIADSSTAKAALQALETAVEAKVSSSSAATYTEPGSNLPLCRTGSGTIGGCTNITDIAAITASSTDTLTNKTLDANGTGNVLKGYGYLQLNARAFMRRGAGVTAPSTTQTDFNFGLPKFSNSTDEATNWIEWVIEVPADVDTSVAMTAKLSFYLGGADTADHDYVVSMCNPAASAAADCTVGTAINLAFDADASGADGDVEYTTETTLTDWAAGVTAGRMLKVRLARDGDDGTNDASTVDSYPLTLTIKYGYTN